MFEVQVWGCDSFPLLHWTVAHYMSKQPISSHPINTLNSERNSFVRVKNTHKHTLCLFEEKAAVDVYKLGDALLLSFHRLHCPYRDVVSFLAVRASFQMFWIFVHGEIKPLFSSRLISSRLASPPIQIFSSVASRLSLRCHWGTVVICNTVLHK